MQIEGSLDQFPIRELIEMIVYSSVTGVLEVRVVDEIGQLFFRDGRPYHSLLGEQVGFDAICRMFEEREAPFRFVAGNEAPVETLWIDPWDLIERAEEQARQWARVRPRIASMAWVPTLRSRGGSDAIHISETIWPVLSAVDGQRSVAAIAEELCVAPLEVCVALVELLEQGLISIRPPGLRGPEPRPFARESAGFLERLLAGAPLSDLPAEPTDLPLPPRAARE